MQGSAELLRIDTAEGNETATRLLVLGSERNTNGERLNDVLGLHLVKHGRVPGVVGRLAEAQAEDTSVKVNAVSGIAKDCVSECDVCKLQLVGLVRRQSEGALTAAGKRDVIADILQDNLSLSILNAARLAINRRSRRVLRVVLAVGSARLCLCAAASVGAVGVDPEFGGTSVNGNLCVLAGRTNVH